MFLVVLKYCKMKKQADSKKSFSVDLHHVHYLHMGNAAIHKPFSDKKGIHCVGDKFDYVVAWQVPDKKRDIIIAK